VFALAVAGCGTDPAPGEQAPMPAVQAGAVNDAATVVDRLGRERFPEHYAGIEITDGRVLVYRTPSPAFDDAVRSKNLNVPVDLRDAPHSARELQALADRIATDLGYWRGEGFEIFSIGARYDGTAVEVGALRPEQLAPRLVERYGPTPPMVAVATGPIVPLPD